MTFKDESGSEALSLHFQLVLHLDNVGNAKNTPTLMADSGKSYRLRGGYRRL